MLQQNSENIDSEIADEFSEDPGSPKAPAATASLTKVSSTAFSLKLKATYPVSTAWGNRLCYYNNGWVNIPTDCYLTNGNYTISDLVPNTQYTFELWYNNNGWVKQTYYFTTDDIPEVLVHSETANLSFEFESWQISKFTNYNNWKNNMQKVYAKMLELTGFTPNNGQKILIKSSRTLPDNVWGQAGTIIEINSKYIPGLINQINNGDWSFGVIHELGHMFTSSKLKFSSEMLANFIGFYAVDQLTAKVYVGNAYYTGGSQLKGYYYSGSDVSYVNTVANGIYHHDGLLYTFLYLKDLSGIGWVSYKSAFAYISAMDSTPSNNIGKLNLFLSVLKNYSSIDVFSKLNR